MGWYGGDGGRLIDSITGLQGIEQPLPEASHETGLMECNWTGSYQWTAPTENRGVSGVYIAKLTSSEGYQSYIIFVVRDDERRSDFLFQTSVTTYQAYNFWPRDVPVSATTTLWHQGKSLYAGPANQPLSWGHEIPEFHENGKQARKVSFNRPYQRDQNSIYTTAGQFFTLGEYNMVRWMEMKQFKVTYTTDVDTDAAADLVNGPLRPGLHNVFLSVGHDEYWSWQMRDNIEKARNRTDQPLNIGWFGANDVHWQIRFENSSIASTPSNAERRTIVAYKDLATSSEPDWKDPQFVPVSAGWSPTNYLTTSYWRENDITHLGPRCPGEPAVPDCYKLPEDELVGVMTTTPTTVTGRGDFQFATGAPYFVKKGVTNTAFPFYNLVGYEADQIFTTYENTQGALTRSFYRIGDSILHDGAINSTATTPSHAVYYELTGNGARVFAAGTVSWGWGVDPFGEPDGPDYNGPNFLSHPATFNQRAQKMTENILWCLKYGGVACAVEQP